MDLTPYFVPGVLTNLFLIAGLMLVLPVVPRQSVFARVAAVSLILLFNARYLAWRWIKTLPGFDGSVETTYMYVFFAIELAAVAHLSWQFIVMSRWSDRSREADENEVYLRARPLEQLPTVDVFIPTYNEGAHILSRTIRAAKNLDYPRFQVHVLDDGKRDWLRDYCAQEGVGYLRRPTQDGFKAGNMNNALRHTHADVILNLDADFAVEPNFLWRTLGFFRDPRIGIVQTPQRFVNPDPVQYNLHCERAFPETQAIFSYVMQPSRDAWNQAFCYGTGFIIRREVLDKIGGFPEESLCEDMYTTYIAMAHGYVTRFLNEVLQVGMAAENIAEYVKQRSRWCKGTLQVLLLKDGPLRSPRLSPLDRLFLLDTIFFWLSHIWLFMLVIAPAIYWWTGMAPFHSGFSNFLSVLCPRMGASIIVLYWLSDRTTLPVIVDVGHYVSVFRLMSSIVETLISPFRQDFSVTAKGLKWASGNVQWAVLLPHVALAALTLLGMGATFLVPDFNQIIFNEDTGFMLGLTSYYLWLFFLGALVCVERRHDGDVFAPGQVSWKSSIPATLGGLSRRMLQ